LTDPQLPAGDQIFLDHVAHFVPDIDAARTALERCGFETTPFAVQTAPTGADGALAPTGTGNVCAMLRAGYLEVLTKTADTPLAAELEAAIARWAGVHLAAFAIAKPEETYQRLVNAGLAMRPIVHMRRPVETAHGPSEARFTILRPKPGVMAEGRIQLLTHHTEDEVWQPRWLDQPNGVSGLLTALIVSDDPVEAGGRFEKLLGIAPKTNDYGPAFSLSRGHIQICAPAKLPAPLDTPPGLPWIAGYALQVESLEKIGHTMAQAGLQTSQYGRSLIAPFPAALGAGYWFFVEEATALPWN
jgi:hypothetical protein